MLDRPDPIARRPRSGRRAERAVRGGRRHGLGGGVVVAGLIAALAVANVGARAASGDRVGALDADADGVPDHRDVCLQARDAPAADDAFFGAFGCAVPVAGARLALVLDGVTFTSGRRDLGIGARRVLDRLARALEWVDEGTYEIAAHTDRAGSPARNLRLSEARARAVRQYLMLRGVDPNRLRASGYGETRPVTDEGHAAGGRTNRRVELERID